jgi:hypothetical protein
VTKGETVVGNYTVCSVGHAARMSQPKGAPTMKTLFISLLLAASTFSSAHALEVGETFSFKSPIRVWACDSLEDLRGLVARTPNYTPGMGNKIELPKSCGTPGSGRNYKVFEKSDDAVCIGLPDRTDGKCTWAIAVADQIAPAVVAAKPLPSAAENDPKGTELQLQFRLWEYHSGGYATLQVSMLNNTMKPFARVAWTCELYDKQNRLVGETIISFNVVPWNAVVTNNQPVVTTDRFEDGKCRLLGTEPVTQRNERLYTSIVPTKITGKYAAEVAGVFDLNYRVQGRAKVITDEESNELQQLERAGTLNDLPGYRLECTPLLKCRFGVK